MIVRERVSTFASHRCTPLVVVAVAYAAAQLIAVTARMRLGWDETVYLSQVSPHIPAAFFSPPRARGITLLPVPVVAVTPSLTALRVYMTALSSAGLVAAYWPWTRLVRPVTAALAALLLASLWVVQFYGNEVMPNLYVAYGAVAAAGWFAHTVRAPGRRPPILLAASLAFVALMRPSDAAWLALPLVVAAAFAGRRRLALLGAIALGLAAGAIEWIGEAYLRFGDPIQRLRASSQIEGGLGWHPAGILMELRSLNDSLLCRPCGSTWHVSTLSLWWPLVPVLAAGGLVLAARERRLALLAPPTACGAVLGASYLLFVGYAAPRFLIPAYALLALPVAELLTAVAAFGRSRWRIATLGLVATGLAFLAIGQQVVLARMVAFENTSRQDYVVIATRLHDLGLRPPCTLSGDEAQPLAFYAGCRSMETGDNPAVTDARLALEARVTRFADVERTGGRPRYTHGWRRSAFTTPAGHHWRIFMPARPAAAPRG
ncbi:MAG: rane protein [Actinoallomurus sp.]|nr:rane protein [Actinoallomurus sp.]